VRSVVEFFDFGEVIMRLVELALPPVGVASTPIGAGKFRVESNRVTEVCNCLVQVTLVR